MMPPQKSTTDGRTALVTVANEMIDGKMNLIEGVRKITALRHYVGDPEDEIFMPLRAIESETDHFPIGAARSQCTPSYLNQIDEEIERYLSDARTDIIAACLEIVRVYG